MPNFTPNNNFEKPFINEQYDIIVHNRNMDMADAALSMKADRDPRGMIPLDQIPPLDYDCF
jgi:hypothetical protein